jgi:hypothetical protein
VCVFTGSFQHRKYELGEKEGDPEIQGSDKQGYGGEEQRVLGLVGHQERASAFTRSPCMQWACRTAPLRPQESTELPVSSGDTRTTSGL